MQRCIWEHEVWKKRSCDHFDFGGIHFGYLFDAESTVYVHLFKALAPVLIDSVSLFLYFEIPSWIFRGEEEVFEDFIAVIKRRLDSDSADVVIDVELEKEVVASLCFLIKVS